MECRVCRQNKTNVSVFVVRAEETPVCKVCAASIYRQMTTAFLEGKTIYEVNDGKYTNQRKKHPKVAVEILNYLFVTLLKKRKHPYTEDRIPVRYLELISARHNDGATVEEMKAVVYSKWMEWKDNPHMKKYIRITTLFGQTKFNEYLAALEISDTKISRNDSAEVKKLISELNYKYGRTGTCNEQSDVLAKKLMSLGFENKSFLNNYLIQKI